MTKLASTDLGRLVMLRSGETTRLRTVKTNVISAAPKTRFQHSGLQAGVYDSGYASPLYGASALSPADIMMLSDVDPVTGGFLDSFYQKNMTSAGIHGAKPTRWAADTPLLAMPIGFQTTARCSNLHKIRPQFPNKLRELKLRVPLWSTQLYSGEMSDRIFGSPGDTNGAGAASRDKLAFQFGISTKLTDAYTGIPAYTPFTFNGQNFYQHDWTANQAWLVNTPWIDSDELDLGEWVDTFDFRSVIQPEAAYQGTGGVVPYTFTGGNYFLRYEFEYNYINAVAAPQNGIKGKGGNYDLALDAFPTPEVPAAFNPTGFPTTVGGGGFGYAPMFMYKVDGEWKTFACDGDSMQAWVGEGHQGSGPNSSVRGSRLGNGGVAQRFVREVLKRPFVNCARASDGDKHKNKAVNWFCRRALFADLGIDVMLSNTGTNDVAVSVVYPAWATSTAKLVNDVIANANGCYIYTQAGTTASSGTGPSASGSNITDGTAKCRQLWAAVGAGDKAAMCAVGVNLTLKSVLPKIQIWSYAIPPGATSTDYYRTVERQTPNANWGPGGPRDVLNRYLSTLQCGNDGFININQWIEDSYGLVPGQTGGSNKFVANGKDYNLCYDSLHFNGNATQIIVTNHPVKPFLDIQTDPTLLALAT